LRDKPGARDVLSATAPSRVAGPVRRALFEANPGCVSPAHAALFRWLVGARRCRSIQRAAPALQRFRNVTGGFDRNSGRV